MNLFSSQVSAEGFTQIPWSCNLLESRDEALELEQEDEDKYVVWTLQFPSHLTLTSCGLVPCGRTQASSVRFLAYIPRRAPPLNYLSCCEVTFLYPFPQDHGGSRRSLLPGPLIRFLCTGPVRYVSSALHFAEGLPLR